MYIEKIKLLKQLDEMAGVKFELNFKHIHSYGSNL